MFDVSLKISLFRNILLTGKKSLILHYKLINMAPSSFLIPPENVKNMTILEKDSFKKVITVPAITVHKDDINKIFKSVKKFLLKLIEFESIVLHSENDSLRQLILNPDLINIKSSVKDIIEDTSFVVDNTINQINITLEYKNWSSDQILRSVLPDNLKVCSGFSRIGHILHFNLRDDYLPYKYLIGQVYLEKTKGIKIVVNKTDIIDNSDNTFRTFNMEILASNDKDNNMVTTVKENRCSFTFDFSKVYWNSRLSTEHERIVKKLEKGDVLYDVMAGVGPFSIPAAKKGCIVLCNDLNPHSFNYLKSNALENKAFDNIQIYNMDGKDFIMHNLKEHMLKLLNDEEFNFKIHITMNLPSLALEFLPIFVGLFSNEIILKLENISEDNLKNVLPLMHVYFFSLNDSREFAIHSVASKLGFCKDKIELKNDMIDIDVDTLNNNINSKFLQLVSEVVCVRRVATVKVMMRVSFYLSKELLLGQERKCPCSDNYKHKKQKVM